MKLWAASIDGELKHIRNAHLQAPPWVPDQVRQVEERRGCYALTPTPLPRGEGVFGAGPRSGSRNTKKGV